MLWKRFLRAALGSAVLVLVVQFQIAEARLTAEPIPLPSPAPAATPAADCCPKPCITYRHTGPRLCCDCTKPPVETTLKVPVPCSKGCEIDVTVCIPGCC